MLYYSLSSLKGNFNSKAFFLFLIFKRNLVLRRFVDRAKPETDAALSWEALGESVRVSTSPLTLGFQD